MVKPLVHLDNILKVGALASGGCSFKTPPPRDLQSLIVRDPLRGQWSSNWLRQSRSKSQAVYRVQIILNDISLLTSVWQKGLSNCFICIFNSKWSFLKVKDALFSYCVYLHRVIDILCSFWSGAHGVKRLDLKLNWRGPPGGVAPLTLCWPR